MRVIGCFFIVPIPIYQLSLLVVLGYTKDQACQIMKRVGGDPTGLESSLKAYGAIAGHEADSGRFYIHFPERMPRSIEDYADLQHEIRHITDYMMEYVGMGFDNGTSSEAYAYLTGYLTEQILKNLGVKLSYGN